MSKNPHDARPGAKHVWVIVRIRMPESGAQFDPTNHLTGTKAFDTEGQAEREADRLNRENSSKGAVYVVVMARLQGTRG